MTDEQTYDEHCDAVMEALAHADAPVAVINMVDKVLRAFYGVLEDEAANKRDPGDFAEAMESTISMMMSNFVSRVSPNSNFDEAVMITQELINSIAARLSDDLRVYFDDKSSDISVSKH